MTGEGVAELSSRAAGIAAHLSTWPRRRVTLPELWRVLDLADPASRTDPRRRHLLTAALDELLTADLVRLPSSRSYDRTETPHLPLFVALPEQHANSTPSTAVVWHPARSWVPEQRLTPGQHAALEQVNRWLHVHRDPLVVPLRERSLEIFGHEKKLDSLITTNSFGPGRLTFELLRTRRALVRFSTEQVGAGDELLIVENSDTFDSLAHALRRRDGHQIGLIGWGAGAAFEASVLSIARIEPPIRRVTYFGDLDEKGLRTPLNAASLAISAGLPTIRPATKLYDALLALAAPQPGQRKATAAGAAAVAAWLDPHHRQRAIAHLTAGERLAQEAVGLQHLLSHDDWLPDH
jgi:hypothetical protein